jgi:hypothetical protein
VLLRIIEPQEDNLTYRSNRSSNSFDGNGIPYPTTGLGIRSPPQPPRQQHRRRSTS